MYSPDERAQMEADTREYGPQLKTIYDDSTSYSYGPAAYVAIFRDRMDDDWDHVATIHIDGCDERYAMADRIMKDLEADGDEVMFYYTNADSVPQTYCPHYADGGTCPND
jgi:hypothetical protein